MVLIALFSSELVTGNQKYYMQVTSETEVNKLASCLPII